MLPGFSAELMPKGHEKESQAKIKRYMTMMDSMTEAGNCGPRTFLYINLFILVVCATILIFMPEFSSQSLTAQILS